MKAVRDTVIVRGREDLDPGISDCILVPDTAKRFDPAPVPDHMCYGEVVSIGPGSAEQPSLEGLRVGDIVTYDLNNVSHAFIEKGAGYQVVPVKALVTAGDKVLLDWVVTVQDQDAMANSISSLVRAPDTILADGQRTEGFTKDGNMRLVFERVVAVGFGRRYRVRQQPTGDADTRRLAYDDVRASDTYVNKYSRPECKEGDLIAFSPSAATRFRKGGKFYRAVPWDEVQGIVEDET